MADIVIDRFITEYLFRFDRSALQRLERRVEQVKNRLNRASQSLIIPAAAASAALGLTTRTVSQFEDALNRAAAAGNLNAAELASVEQQARQLGATTRFTATDAANAQASLFQAGLELNEVLRVTPDVLSNAAAGEIALARSSELVTQALNSFGAGTDQSRRLVDLAAKGFQSGTVSIEEMLDMLARTGATVRGFNIDMEGSAAALVRLRSNGIQAETSARGFSSILARLAIQTGETRRGLEELGGEGLAESVRFAVASGNYEQAFLSLRQAFRGLPDTQAAELRGLIFGLEQQRVGNVLLQDIDLIRELQTELRNNAGESQRLATTMERGLGGALRSLRSAFEAAVLTAGNREGGIGNALESLIQRGTAFLRWLASAEGWTQRLGSAMLFAGPALLGVAVGARVLAFALGPLMVAFRGLIWLGRELAAGTLWLRIQLLALAIQAKAVAIWANIVRVAKAAWAAVQWALNIAMSANPVGAVITAIVALIGIVTLVVLALKNWEAGWTAISNAALVFWDILKAVVLPLWRQLVSIWTNDLQPVFEGLFGAIIELADVIWSLIPGLDSTTGGSSRLATALMWISRAMSVLAPALGFAIRFLLMPMRIAFTVLAGVIRAVARVLTGDFRGAWFAVLETALRVVKSMVDLINAVPGVNIDTSALDAKIREYQARGGAITIGGLAGGDEGEEFVPPGPRPPAPPGEPGLPGLPGAPGLPGVQTPLPVASPPTAFAGAGAGGFGGNREYTINLGDVIIDARGSDSEEIAANISRDLRDQVQAAIANVDNDIDR